jgi:transglutaminase-like putative cysteine protease
MLPERARDFRRLAWTTAGLAAALGPHLLRLRPWISAFVLAAAAWRLIAERRGWRLPGTLARTVIALAATAGVFFGYATIAGLDGGTALLALMSALKLLETRTTRDHAILIFIGWFLCLAAFLYAQDVATTAWVLPVVWLLAAALFEVTRSSAQGRAALAATAAMLVKAAPIALVLFLFFPRLAGSFWGAPSAERAVTGLTEDMSPGDISELTLNDVVAFRVRFAGSAPPPALRYWRGLVLSHFDGYTWSRGESRFFPMQSVRFEGAPVDYTLTLEPTGQRLLLALDMVERWPGSVAARGWDLALQSRRPIHAVTQYEARSYPRYRAGETLPASLRNLNLQLPRDRNPGTLALARRMRSRTPDDRAYAAAVLDMFRRQEFHYTLTPPGLARDSVDDFLFRTRRGFCEHYASAFTTMMRAAGIPARVVGGYQGGDWNPIGGYLIVRQSHAHAWSEVWLEGGGWTRMDPTAAIAPERIERGIESVTGAGSLAGTLIAESGFGWRARMWWDAANARWNDWIVKYDREKQDSLFARLGVDDADWRHFGLALGAGLVLGALVLVAWLAVEFRPRARDAAARAYRRFVRRLARRGIDPSVGEAPRDFARRVERLRPDLAAPARAITEIYLRMRYLPAPATGDLRLLRALVARFRP